MLTEVEKYHLFDQFLKGKLSPSDVARLRESTTSFEEELELHKVVGSLIEDHYYLDIKATTQNIIRQKGSINWWKWPTVAGLVTFMIGTGYFLYYDKVEEKKKIESPSAIYDKHSLQLDQTILKPNKNTSNTIEDTEKNIVSTKPKTTPITDRTTNISINETEQPKDNFNSIPAEVSSKPIRIKDQLTSEGLTLSKIEISALKKASIVKETNAAEVSSSTVTLNNELLFRPLLNEFVSFPISPEFNGELNLFDVEGKLLLRYAIKDGKPNQWDGTITSGGVAGSGQYIYILKSVEGTEVGQGYVTVVR